ncbi:MAG: CDP-diacylglycerol--glycerol-3-phosphate 3-phosphatidyltransferase [Rickettsiales bacterium]|nr:CDP-diacylglycerol--glycerol-3-phosphate 3-phosphatidyltransferase [Pseudomonadota bacterium]MDA0966903.1 CDP-diacylglycerol--glycerol-3-phosphate 3-phosphatidyltransferase [Pseudomonadota bacterium]MDG4544456.1 CDP-diacylglycerol--glycerol-3-phosphate 3-phosphatidyltransferase [Rickettsiales bacterium]MDG4546607.1 CDP-diacylglycerol--glycerol-3-phosphate 3-phosphatidyltransferase [Rickettsiales bacterium]MDG4548732.1 CDP-diacylglycerol--glycerol-3-phosphate 3-phosphatidyltransferase [Ricket
MDNKKIPNILTVFRIVIIPILVASFFIEGKMYHWVAAGLFIIASITDFFDGYLARTLKATSKLGRFLDPIADKLLVASAILMLVHFDGIGRYDIVPAVAILCREIMVSGLREFLAEINVSVPVTKLAKVKTAVQMTAIFLLLLGVEGPSFDEVEEITEINLTVFIGRILLWVSAVLTVITGYAYLKAGLKHMKEADEKK